MKKWIKRALIGLGIGCAAFTAAALVLDLVHSGGFSLADWVCTKEAFGFMAVGLGVTLPSAVHESKRLSLTGKILLHAAAAAAVLLAASFVEGWISPQSGLAVGVFAFLGEMAAALLIWLAFIVFYARLEEKTAERIEKRREKR